MLLGILLKRVSPKCPLNIQIYSNNLKNIKFMVIRYSEKKKKITQYSINENILY